MPHIIPIKDLRNTTEISDLCKEKQEPIFVTKNGYGDLVVMSMETYDKIMGSREIDHAITVAESELSAGGEPIEAKSGLAELKEKYFG